MTNPDPQDDACPVDNGRRAMIRAVYRAARMAKAHNQQLVYWQDGQIVYVDPDDLPPLPELAPIVDVDDQSPESNTC